MPGESVEFSRDGCRYRADFISATEGVQINLKTQKQRPLQGHRSDWSSQWWHIPWQESAWQGQHCWHRMDDFQGDYQDHRWWPAEPWDWANSEHSSSNSGALPSSYDSMPLGAVANEYFQHHHHRGEHELDRLD